MNLIPGIITESTRNLRGSAIFLLFTVATIKVSHILYRYLHRNSRFSSLSPSSSTAKSEEALRRSRILSSKLYFDVPQFKVPVIYSKLYDIAFLGIEKLSLLWHCFPIVFRSKKFSSHFGSRLEELYWQQNLKERGWAINMGGGFHHCSAEKEWDTYKGLPAEIRQRQKLDRALEIAGQRFDPELVVYNAGTDILDGDPLGRLKISPEGIALRDEKVFRFARERKVPIVMLTSGGYMKSSAGVIADSMVNLSNKGLIDTRQSSKIT